MRYEPRKPLPISPRTAVINARRTIQSVEDALVELLTNCDDSYLKDLHMEVGGDISIHIELDRDGNCIKLSVADDAAGMTRSMLERSLEYGVEGSSIGSHRTVRGYFGCGLKEAIIGLGNGEIRTHCTTSLCISTAEIIF